MSAAPGCPSVQPLETLELAVQEGIATVRLNRPQALNAINLTMADELAAVLEQLRRDGSVRAVVLTGAGSAFCAGGDMRGTARAGPRSGPDLYAGMERFHRMTMALHQLPQPVIAAVDGVAYGAGFSLLLLCDLVLLSERARLCMVFQRVGLVPDCGALYSLPRAVGLQRAKELMLSGRELSAAEALQLGIALEVVPPERLAGRALQMAQALCGASPTAMALTKRALQAAPHSDLASVLALEASAQAVVLSSGYVAEAARRFVAHAPAQFGWPPAVGGEGGPCEH